ncbi:MAG: ABC transporter permease [Sulfurovum sp.]|nr:ABC transporter permease [Sulfurovaceae bacterium]
MKYTLASIWAYRYFIISSIQTEFRSKFARSKFGGLWMIFHPLAQVLIYALVLSAVLKAKLSGIDSQYAYAIYLMAGMVAWNLFMDITSRSLNVFIDNGNLIQKMSFPKLTLPLIVIGSSLTNFAFLFFAMIVVFGFLGHFTSVVILWIPILMLITVILAIGIGLTLGILNVFIRDIGQIMTIIFQFWFWLTPIVYSKSMIPEEYQNLLLFNPMSGIVEGYHSVLVYDKMPNLELLIYPSILAITTLGLGLFLYKKSNKEMADLL